jgi:hypothetical protein
MRIVADHDGLNMIIMTEVYLISLDVAAYETPRIMALLREGGVMALRRNLVTMFVEAGLTHAFCYEPRPLLHSTSNTLTRTSTLQSMLAELPSLKAASLQF